MQHLVAFLDLIEYRAAFVEERSFHRVARCIEKLGSAAQSVADAGEECHVKRCIADEHHFIVKLYLLTKLLHRLSLLHVLSLQGQKKKTRRRR